MAKPGTGTGKITIKGTRNNDDIAVVAQGVMVNGTLRDTDEAGILAGFIIKGDAGDDEIVGGAGPDEIDGGTGTDTIFGGAGYDKLLGGGGDDTLIDAYDGATFDGGRGIDTLDFSGSTTAVAVDLNGMIVKDFEVYRGTDGILYAELNPQIEGNHVSGVIKAVEEIIGSSENDYLVGNGLQNLIRGGDGDDYIAPGDVNTITDYYFGEGDNDSIGAGSGNDELTGGTGADTFMFDPSNHDGDWIIHDYSKDEGDKVVLFPYNGDVSFTPVDYQDIPSLQASFGNGDSITFVGVTDSAQIDLLLTTSWGGP